MKALPVCRSWFVSAVALAAVSMAASEPPQPVASSPASDATAAGTARPAQLSIVGEMRKLKLLAEDNVRMLKTTVHPKAGELLAAQKQYAVARAAHGGLIQDLKTAVERGGVDSTDADAHLQQLAQEAAREADRFLVLSSQLTSRPQAKPFPAILAAAAQLAELVASLVKGAEFGVSTAEKRQQARSQKAKELAEELSWAGWTDIK